MIRRSFRIGFFAASLALTPSDVRAHSTCAHEAQSAASTGGAQFGFSDAFVYCTPVPNSTGRPAGIDWTGSLNMAVNDFTLLVRGAPPLAYGRFIYGIAPAEHTFTYGILCMSTQFLEMGPIASANGAGVVRRKFDFIHVSGHGIILPGMPRYFQYMYRDTTPGGFNFSNGLCATFSL